MRVRADLPETVAAAADDTMLLGTAIYAFFLGLGFCVAGRMGRKPWIISLGVLLALSAASYLGWRLL